MKNNTVGTTEITPVETEVTRSEKQESYNLNYRKFNMYILYLYTV